MSQLFRTSKQTLVILAASVWIIGGIALLRGGLGQVQQARALNPSGVWMWVFLAAGTLLGIFQATTIFSRSCRKNIRRIAQLQDPHLWQFFRPGFFLALAGMISAGVLLDLISSGRYFLTLFVAGLDFALTISLLGSSYVYWTDWFRRGNSDR